MNSFLQLIDSFDITHGIMSRTLYCVNAFPANLNSRSAET